MKTWKSRNLRKCIAILTILYIGLFFAPAIESSAYTWNTYLEFNSNNGKDQTFDDVGDVGGSTITIDGNYTDWDFIPHSSITWNPSSKISANSGALYLDDSMLYGHFKMNDKNGSQMGFSYMELTINGSRMIPITVAYRNVDNSLSWANTNKMPVGSTLNLGVYYNNYPKQYFGNAAFTITDKKHSQGDELEFYIDLNSLSTIAGIPVEAMREFSLINPNIGRESVSTAGTSTGASIGILLCVVVVIGGYSYVRKSKMANH